MAKKQTTGRELVKWDEEFSNLARESTKGMDLPTAKFISMRGGKLSFAGADVPGNELRSVILGWVYENQYYNTDFDPNTPQVPVCYAFGQDQDEMEPHDKSPDKQSESCATCPLNEFESADRGRGKACKNVLRLAMIAESDLDDLAAAEIVYMKVPVMSVKNFLVYAKKQVSEVLKRPYWAVVTTINIEPDDKSQFKVVFEVADKIENSKLFSPLKELWGKTMDEIDFPYPEAIEKRTLPKRGAGSAAKKPAAKQKFARR